MSYLPLTVAFRSQNCTTYTHALAFRTDDKTPRVMMANVAPIVRHIYYYLGTNHHYLHKYGNERGVNQQPTWVVRYLAHTNAILCPSCIGFMTDIFRWCFQKTSFPLNVIQPTTEHPPSHVIRIHKIAISIIASFLVCFTFPSTFHYKPLHDYPHSIRKTSKYVQYQQKILIWKQNTVQLYIYLMM